MTQILFPSAMFCFVLQRIDEGQRESHPCETEFMQGPLVKALKILELLNGELTSRKNNTAESLIVEQVHKFARHTGTLI